jgi:hypothetical protein
MDASTTANGPAPLFQDKEWITIDNTGGPNAGHLYVSWTRFTATDSQIMFTRSTDGGATFSDPIALSAKGSTQGSMPAVGANGEVYVAWFDDAGPQLMIQRSDDGGATFANPVAGGGAITRIRPLPDNVNGNIRANSFPSIAVDDASGTVYVVFAQHNSNTLADVFLVRSADKGQTWSAPLVTDDGGTATDQWMPSVAVASNGVVGVMFYDRRNDPNNLNIDIYLALSNDSGVTFQPNQRITTASFPPAVNFDPAIAANYMGDYNQIVASGTNFYMAWGDNRDIVNGRNDPNVYFAGFPTQ